MSNEKVDPKLLAWAHERRSGATNPVDRAKAQVDKASTHLAAKTRGLSAAKDMHAKAGKEGGDTKATGVNLARATHGEKHAREALSARQEAHGHEKDASQAERSLAKHTDAAGKAEHSGDHAAASKHIDRMARSKEALDKSKGAAKEAHGRADALHAASNDEYNRDTNGEFAPK